MLALIEHDAYLMPDTVRAFAMAKAPITKRTVDAARAANAEYVVWDHGGKETVKGFGIKVTPAGSKVYLYRYRLARPGKAAETAPRKITIGRHGDITPDQARVIARDLAALVAQGIDPRQRELDEMAARDEAKRLGLIDIHRSQIMAAAR